MRICEAQVFVKEILEKHGVKKNSLASLVGMLEELGELSSILLVKEGFKSGSVSQAEIDYKLAEILFELLKLAEDCNVDLEKAFTKAIERWKEERPQWK